MAASPKIETCVPILQQPDECQAGHGASATEVLRFDTRGGQTGQLRDPRQRHQHRNQCVFLLHQPDRNIGGSAQPVYSGADGVVFNKNQTTLVICPAGKTGSYAILNSVTNLGNYAFLYLLRLTNVSIPNSVTSIGDSASLLRWTARHTIPDSVTSLGTNAFYNCLSLANVTMVSGVTNLGSTVFQFCLSLTNITIGSNVTSNRNLCVRNTAPICQHHDSRQRHKYRKCRIRKLLHSCQRAIGSNVTSNRHGAFADCAKLPHIAIPDSVTALGALRSITAPICPALRLGAASPTSGLARSKTASTWPASRSRTASTIL